MAGGPAHHTADEACLGLISEIVTDRTASTSTPTLPSSWQCVGRKCLHVVKGSGDLSRQLDCTRGST